MPIKPTYPGVYIEELSSGVHAITGVSTSVTAFVGLAKTGPVNQATRILSYADYERNFGGLVDYSDMSYAINQFFLNGGSEAWVVRVASSKTHPDALKLKESIANNPREVLEIDALAFGQTDRTTYVYVERPKNDNTFDLVIVSVSNANSSDIVTEVYRAVTTVKSDDKRVENQVNGISKFVTVKRLPNEDVDTPLPVATASGHGSLKSEEIADASKIPTGDNNTTLRLSLDSGTAETIAVYGHGTLTSADIADATQLPTDDNNTTLRISLDGGTAETIAIAHGTLTSADIADATQLPTDDNNTTLRISLDGDNPETIRVSAGLGKKFQTLEEIATAIQSQVIALRSADPAYKNFTCKAEGKKLVLTSGGSGPSSSVTVTKAPNSTLAADLGRLETATAGKKFQTLEEIATAIQSQVTALRSADPAYKNFTCKAEGKKLVLTSGGSGPSSSVTVTKAPNSTLAADLGRLETATAGKKFQTLEEIATAIQAQVTALKPADPAFKKFTCSVNSKKLVLTSGSYGPSSSVKVTSALNSSLARDLGLLQEGTNAATPGNASLDSNLSGGKDGPFADPGEILNAFIDSRLQFKGIYALEKVDLFNILCLPGITDNQVISDAASYCDERRAFLIVDCESGKTPNDMYNAIISTQTGAIIPKVKNATIYYPRVVLADPLDNGKLRVFPASGTIAGVYARTDSARGVWKAPAGTDATLVGVQGLEYALTDGENGILNPEAVNALRVFPAFGPVAWGARTLRGGDDTNDSDNKYIPVRRLTYFLEESLYRGTKWVVFEPNDEPLWAQIRLNVGAFMNTLFRQGAFKGQTPREAYLVKCDKETTTPDDINNGIVNILVGFAPLKPAEFVIIKVQQLAGQTTV